MSFPTKCRTCGAPMLMTRTAAGRWMPLDAKPVPDGGFVRVRDIAVAYKADEHPDYLDRYTSHFATCPQAAQHRRRT